ncbi:MAG: hypothetical protein HND52_00550 [Ignavibacteriae bacterium]|nr:hypothetical protein [Ignavibacteriota bacterium]NOG96436.1 hypothetical protein [Ignavibacteriota bacterium]
MKKFYLITLFLVAIGIVSLGFTNNQSDEKHPDVDWSIGCQDCHAEETPDIYKAWENSSHGMVNFGCYICHGDGEVTFYSQGSDATCGGCHAGQLVEFEKTKFNSCYDCHNGHTLKFHNE